MTKNQYKNKKIVRLKHIIIIIVGLLTALSIFSSFIAKAAKVVNFSDTLSSHIVGEAANHTISFLTPSGISAGENIVITFANGFDLSSINYADIDLIDDSGSLPISAAASGLNWGVSVSGQEITFQSDVATIAPDSVITLLIGTHANTGQPGSASIVNPDSPGNYPISISGSFSDYGHTQTVIMVSNSILVTARVASPSVPPGDTVPPLIQSVSVININNNSARVVWTTNENSTSIVRYGLTTAYEIGTISDFNYTTSHSVDLTGLNSGTTYHIVAISADFSGNSSASSDVTFTTSESAGAYLNLRVLPEKRLPPEGNSSANVKVRLFNRGGVAPLIVEEIITNDYGYDTSIDLEALTLPNYYDLLVKGESHLQIRKNNVSLNDSSPLVDMSDNATRFMKAGDVNGVFGDNYINAMDLGVLALHIYSSNARYDLNHDGIVNGLDFSTTIKNIFLSGDY